jgi:hypothetical protein
MDIHLDSACHVSIELTCDDDVSYEEDNPKGSPIPKKEGGTKHGHTDMLTFRLNIRRNNG